MSRWVEGEVIGRRQWTDRLYSLRVAAPGVNFIAGQFARVALPALAGSREAMVGRPYSFVNAPDEFPHEFYFNVLPDGPLSPRLAALGAGQSVWLQDRPNGFFTIAEIPASRSLWCLATGTGLGPFLSILRTEEAWQRFDRIVLVHAVRQARDLSYADVIAGIVVARSPRFVFVPVVSRERHPGALSGRIPSAIADGTLEARAGIELAAETAHAMLCGNPDMLRDTQAALQARMMRRHRRREPGHFTLEAYW
jgi:ferredoxin/flavodoxin---NADP+ reductase